MAVDTQELDRLDEVAAVSFADHARHLRGRHVLVTGVGGGIGRAVAAAFAAAGSVVIGIDRTDSLAADALDELPRPEGAAHASLGADFADPDAVAATMKEVRKISKDIGAVVNVAGYADDQPAQMVTQESLDAHLKVNFASAVQIAQYASRLMTRTGGGTIVNVSSVTGISGNAGQLAYGAAKAALNNATVVLSIELARFGLRVNSVAPGVVDTPMTRALSEPDRDRLLARVGMARPAQPREIADVVLWLSTPASSFVTGQVIRVDGGML